MSQRWLQVNEDGFGFPPGGSIENPKLLSFGGDLYAINEHGLFRMDRSTFRKWDNIYAPAGNFSPPLGAYLYCQEFGGLYYIKQGDTFDKSNWHYVTPSTPVTPLPMTVFNGQMYAVTKHFDVASGKQAFSVWRSPDIGAKVMKWQEVVPNSFGDPQNNHDLGFMGEFGGRLYAGTDTLEGNFGGPQPTTGVEIWESLSGDPGSWSQVNKDGFGTEVIVPGTGQPMRTNHVIGSWTTYRASGQNESHLYIGTKSPWGAEVWRYDGNGQDGWENVTPHWAGVAKVGSWPGRNEAMVVFGNCLYLAEGFPTANLAKYDGINWSLEVEGPNPFDPQNRGFTSAALNDGRLYVHAGISATKGDQVWGYPFADVASWMVAVGIT